MKNKRELVLLLIFLGALAVGGGVIGWSNLSRNLQAQKTLLKQKETELDQTRFWIEKEETWLAKNEWLAAHPPPQYRGPETDAAFVQEIQTSLGHSKIEIVEQRIEETKAEGGMVEVGISLVLSSPLEQLVRWLHETQKIDAFRTVTRIKLKSDADDTKIRTEISLVQLYNKSDTLPTP